MNQKDIADAVASLPWQALVPFAIAILQKIDAAATNPVEKMLLEAAIMLLQRIAPPAPSADA